MAFGPAPLHSALGESRMKTEILRQLASLGVTLLISLFVWKHYRRRTFPLADRYSTFRPRLLTGFIDSCVLWPIGFVTSILLCVNVPKGVVALLMVIESLAWLVYTVVMHARYGQTLGKMVTKVGVADFRTEGKISWLQAWLREGIPMVLSLGLLGFDIFAVLTRDLTLGDVAYGQALLANKTFWFLTALPGLWFLAEVLTMLTNEKRRALHDFIAGTVVVRTNIDQGSFQPDAAPNGGPATPVTSSPVLEGPPSVS
jgi:uncharacterized RDD family membrane protein YckC